MFLVFASSIHDKVIGEALFSGVGKGVLDKWLVSIVVLLLYLEYKNFDVVTFVVTFEMLKSFTVFMF